MTKNVNDINITNNTEIPAFMLELQKKIQQTLKQKDIVQIAAQSTTDKIDVISTGSLVLDACLGVGGVPVGRIIEIFGPESSGKSTIALQIAVNAQKKFTDKGILFVDLEHAFDQRYAQRLGLDMTRTLFSQPSSGEEALNLVLVAAQTGFISLIIVDSVSALIPQREIDGEIGDQMMGSQARLMSQALRNIASAASRNNTTVIFTNQLRLKIGVMYGNPETTTGGQALKYYATARIDLRKQNADKKSDEFNIKQPVKIKVVKNKVAPPYREGITSIIFGRGVDNVFEIVQNFEIIGEKSGAKYTITEKGFENSAFGREKIETLLRNLPPEKFESLCQIFTQKLISKLINIDNALEESENVPPDVENNFVELD